MRKARICALVCTLGPIVGCYNPTNPNPSTGDHELNVSYQIQESSFWCSLADASMWIRYVGSPYASGQSDILDYMNATYPWDVGYGGSLAQAGIQAALSDFSGISTDDEFYTGDAEKRRAVADLQKGIANGNPTIVVTQSGLHAILVKGASWHQLGDYQPNLDYITYHDPGYAGNISDSVGYFAEYSGAGDANADFFELIERTGQYHSTDSELAEFDEWGGTYDGDSNPPDGCGQCAMLTPSEALWHFAARLFSAPITARLAFTSRYYGVDPKARLKQAVSTGPGRNDSHHVRREIFVPRPYGPAPQDAEQNMMTGFEQTHLANVEGWQDLPALVQQGRFSISSIQKIVSLSRHPDYWLISIRADGAPYAQALVSDEGWLISVMRVISTATAFEPPDVGWASAVVSRAGIAASNVRAIHMFNNFTATSLAYSPLFELTLATGTTLYIAPDQTIWAEQNGGQKLAVQRDGVHTFARVR